MGAKVNHVRTIILRKILKNLGWLVLALLLGTSLLTVWYWRASLPKTDGSVKLAGLGAAVDVIRDKEGIPHIYAKSPAEAYFALGITSEAQTAAAVLGHNFPDSRWYKDAYNLVKSGGLEPSENQGSWISKTFKKIGLG